MSSIINAVGSLLIWLSFAIMLANLVIGFIFFDSFKLSLTNRLNLLTAAVMLALLPFYIAIEHLLGAVLDTQTYFLLGAFSFILFCLGIRLTLLSLTSAS